MIFYAITFRRLIGLAIKVLTIAKSLLRLFHIFFKHAFLYVVHCNMPALYHANKNMQNIEEVKDFANVKTLAFMVLYSGVEHRGSKLLTY